MNIVLVLLIGIPLIAGLLGFAMRDAGPKFWALVASLLTLGVSCYACFQVSAAPQDFITDWIPRMGARFSLHADSMSSMLCLLTAIVFPVVIISNWNKEVKNPQSFYSLMLLSQAGLMGVFLSFDAFLFYFFWELALIPVYFLCSIWGGERRIAVTFKFFVYTFLGSLMMLSAIIYLSLQTQGAYAFSWQSIVAAGAALGPLEQHFIFWLIFIAFAIKMPIFPFHTWQPDAYEQSPTPVTIILSALMVKMGMYGVLRWLLPVVPEGVAYWSDTVIILSVIGIIYASFIAIRQSDIKRLIAYSSIAHMGLMNMAAFAPSNVGFHGILVQMFNHGINITGMWLIVSMIEKKYGTRNMKEMGGMAIVAPKLTIALVLISLANIALPLTNGFVGEFMLFNGIFLSNNDYHIWYMILAGTGVILGAIYTLNMIQKVAYGEQVAMQQATDTSTNEFFGLLIIIAIILILGFYPAPLLDATAAFVGL